MGQELSKTDIENIQKQVNLTPEEIKQWYEEYRKNCKQGNALTLDEFKDIYKKMFQGNASEFAENVFRTFDRDGNGTVDFEEFMIGIGVTVNDDKEKKLEWAFKLYDIDGNGTIDKEEMSSIVKSIYMLNSKAKMATVKETPEEVATKMFAKMDVNKDGVISWEEFKAGATKDPLMLEVLNMKFTP